MLLRKWVMPSLCGLVLAVSVVTRWPLPACASAALGEPTAEITLRLDKPEVTPGEIVSLEELIPTVMDAKVTGISHDILRIGCYDRHLGRLVNLSKPSFSQVNPHRLFDKLPESRASPHGVLFDIRTPKYKGVEFSCRPNRLGVFLLTATWYLWNREAGIASNPVILVVKPPVDISGQPVVKPEWLAAEGWGHLEEGHIRIRKKR